MSSNEPHLCFRSFVEALKADNDLVGINDPIDPNLEAAAITRLVCENDEKAPLFNNLIGAKDGFFRILGAPASQRKSQSERYGRLARHLALPPTASMREILDKMLEADKLPPIPPRVVPTGPCKENVLEGDQIDLTKLPVPMVHKSDGGAYIQTFAYLADPPDVEEGKPRCPLGSSVRRPPAAIMASSMPILDGVTEAEYVGAMVGQPIELTKCDTNDIYVPANSEIVLEGTLSTTDTGPEGPFGEMHGYIFPEDMHICPKYKVNKITYRNNAILPMSSCGKLTDETHTMIGSLAAAEIRKICQKANLPVLDAFAPFISQVTWVALRIDTSKLPTRCKPGVDEVFYDDVRAFPLILYNGHGGKKSEGRSAVRGGKVVSNALMDIEYTQGRRNWEAADFNGSYPEDVKSNVLGKWEKLGFGRLEKVTNEDRRNIVQSLDAHVDRSKSRQHRNRHAFTSSFRRSGSTRLWIVEEEEHDDSKEDNQRRNEHECEQEQTQPKGEALAGEKPAGHMFGESGFEFGPIEGIKMDACEDPHS
ncbi:hypothetical protein AN7164.2 [Aspergillus nidulans FGSC A4]|uniref:Phenacrylate decarboxylase n=1 Tax=Emericella nidulans (strain FGSC A4 / ATCC 38163 / CBS 112.46 / NRRL 194 / M139) TaxID=227321 RepID=Q5AX16_EMENI|nr:hypothetical protein [Aspergillus nidulans FGSC A4]EAA61416.1 hypothetical protein AN7164.2 [Aspergillus nidulans FGSC A4]CBF78948.1 TPA: conserved hypothetical protein [Aspergillus nidulans FGSC A4]|eukprot:XP_664768.1 hypothetical protein AN7164.2 [Aspergillus nidulans FGSC A4]